MKTVLHLIETGDPGGAEKMLISVAEGLDQGRYQSLVCLLREGWLAGQLRKKGIETLVVPQRRSFDLDWLIRLGRLIRSRNVDLIHAHEFAMNVYGSMLSAVTRVPIVATIHGKNYYPEKWRRRLLYRLVAYQAKMVAVSNDLKQFIVSGLGIPERSIRVLHNGIDPAPFQSDSRQREKTRRDLGVSETQTIVGTVGNLYPVKGQTYLLQAAARVLKHLPKTVFIIAGQGRLLSDLQNEAKGLGIDQHVQFLGFREDIPALLQAMDVFVLPSLSEGLSLSILEAMAAGKPVVATDVGGNREVIQEGQTGFLVPAMDANALADKLLALLGNPDLIRHMGTEGLCRMKTMFSVDRMVMDYQKLYEEGR